MDALGAISAMFGLFIMAIGVMMVVIALNERKSGIKAALAYLFILTVITIANIYLKIKGKIPNL